MEKEMRIGGGVRNKNLGGEKRKKMKTKNKAIAMVEIAVVLFSVFLVALPVMVIAADQTTQKAANTSTITTASEDDYVLDIYGNANEDDTIDMRDLTYVKLIFFGKKPETELSDAKYDGKINPVDFIQIKLIIVGKEKELTIIDTPLPGATTARTVTVKKPIKRIGALTPYSGEAVRMLGDTDKIVLVSSSVTEEKIYFPELSKLPSVGKYWSDPDIELILSLNPDLLITLAYYVSVLEKIPESIPVVGLDLYGPQTEELVKLGYIFGKKDEAKCYIEDFHDKYLDPIKAWTEGLSEEERPKVYVEYKPYQTYAGTSVCQKMIDMTGGKNIFADIPSCMPKIDAEEVIERNPDIIIRHAYVSHIGSEGVGYAADDPSGLKVLRDEVLNRPELADVAAVKNGRVYVVDGGLNYGADYPIAIVYWAKWFHPELFADLDPKAIHQEYLTKFQGLDYDLDKHGVFVYPEPS